MQCIGPWQVRGVVGLYLTGCCHQCRAYRTDQEGRGTATHLALQELSLLLIDCSNITFADLWFKVQSKF